MSPTPRNAPRHARGGYALPLVLLLTIVAGLTASVMLTRHAAQVRTVERQITSYQTQHGVRGIQELVGTWVAMNAGRELEDLTDPDGLVLSIEPGDGTRIEIRMAQASGRLLTELDAVEPDIRLDLADAGERLRDRVRDDRRLRNLTREVGPPGIAIQHADETVLETVIAAAAGPGAVPEILSSLQPLLDRALDDQSPITSNEIATEITRSDLEPAEAASLARLLGVRDNLWEMELRVIGVGINAAAGELARYRAMVTVPETSSSMSIPFLSWEDITGRPEQRR